MLVYINLIEFLLLLGVIFITFFSELVNPVKVTRIISNLSLFFMGQKVHPLGFRIGISIEISIKVFL
jgi:hypothetical protein